MCGLLLENYKNPKTNNSVIIMSFVHVPSALRIRGKSETLRNGQQSKWLLIWQL